MQSTIIQRQTRTSKDLDLVIKEGLVTQAMGVLTSGTFLVAYALKLGATNFQIGIITAIPLFANILQIASVYFVKRSGSRKKVVVACTAMGRAVYILIALLPFLGVTTEGIIILMLALCVQHGMGAISTGAWSSWMRDVIPQNQLGSFFSKRLLLCQIVSVLLGLGCAFLIHHVLQHYGNLEIYCYGLLFFIGAICGLTGSYMLSKTPEPMMPSATRIWFRLIKKPLLHRNFRNLMLYMASWNFAINLSVPFATVYMLQTLALGLPTVIGLTTLTQVVNVIFLRLWGRYADQYGNKAVLTFCAPLYLFSILSWIYTTMPGKYEFTMPLLILIHVLNGIATAGTSLAASSMGLKLAPKKDSVVYLSLLSFTSAVASGIAPLLSGWLAFWFVDTNVSWTFQTHFNGEPLSIFLLHLRHWDFFFIFSFVFGLFAMFRLTKVKESGMVIKEATITENQQTIVFKLMQLVRLLPLSMIQALSCVKIKDNQWRLKRKVA